MAGKGTNGSSPGPVGKGKQKNVSVYLGEIDGWQAQALKAISRKFNLSEAEVFREAFFRVLKQWGLVYPEAERMKEARPNMAAIRALQDAAGSLGLPDDLDNVLRLESGGNAQKE